MCVKGYAKRSCTGSSCNMGSQWVLFAPSVVKGPLSAHVYADSYTRVLWTCPCIEDSSNLNHGDSLEMKFESRSEQLTNFENPANTLPSWFGHFPLTGVVDIIANQSYLMECVHLR